MANNTKAGFPTATMTLTSKLAELSEDVKHVIASGDTEQVRKMRVRIINLRKSVSGLTKSFDDALTNAQTGFNGEDFLKGCETVLKRERKGRPRKEVVIDETDFL